jgi:hypothetical protein
MSLIEDGADGFRSNSSLKVLQEKRSVRNVFRVAAPVPVTTGPRPVCGAPSEAISLARYCPNRACS